MSIFNQALQQISKSSDLLIALFILFAIAVLVLPIPSFLLDILVALNFTMAITLVIISLYIQGITKISVYPSLLLVSTLYRLSINVAAARQILLKAYAGNIIKAFGEFIVGGNFVVGAVVFLLVTIVQFIVIVKGTERVAEVAARFALDSLPGQQMAIEADVRSGTLDQTQAKKKRADLELQSQLYGSMDGALKFVKGDAIASLIITVVNILGGLIVGMLMHGMSAGIAAKTYILLTIGQGLSSQIPAFLYSFSAGIIMTRASSSSGTESENLGAALGSQLLQQPRALMLTGGALILLSLVPGFPIYILTPLGAIATIGGYFLNRKSLRKLASMTTGPEASMKRLNDSGHTLIQGNSQEYSVIVPVILELGSILSDLIKKRKDNVLFMEDTIPQMRDALYNDIGISCPGVNIRTDSPVLKENMYMILLNEVPVVHGKIVSNHVLSNETERELTPYNIPVKKEMNSIGMPSYWVPEQYISQLNNLNIKYWTPTQAIVLHLSFFYKKYASEFLGLQEMKGLLGFNDQHFPDLTKEVSRLLPLQKLAEIFRRLVEEEISVKDTRTIFESLVAEAATEKDPVVLTEFVRGSLRRLISYKHSAGSGSIAVYLLDASLENKIRGSIKETSSGSYLTLDPEVAQNIIREFSKKMPQYHRTHKKKLVVLTATDIRRFVHKLLHNDFPGVSVLSPQEIIPTIQVQPLGKIIA